MARRGTDREFDAAYRQLLVGLAAHIVEVASSYPLPDSTTPLLPFDEMPTAFERPFPPVGAAAEGALEEGLEGEGPRYVLFAFVVANHAELAANKVREVLATYGAGGGSDWKPFAQKRAVSYAQQAVQLEEGELEYQRVEFTPNLVNDLIEADKKNKIVIIVVDTWSLHLKTCRDPMRELDGRLFERYSIVVPWHEDQETQAKADALAPFSMTLFASNGATGPFMKASARSRSCSRRFPPRFRPGSTRRSASLNDARNRISIRRTTPSNPWSAPAGRQPLFSYHPRVVRCRPPIPGERGLRNNPLRSNRT